MSTRIHPITMPKWGIEMQEGTITAWQIAPGQQIAKGEPLLDVETEKIVNSVEAPVAGTLRRIVADVGETHAVGALIGVFADPEVSDSDIDAFIAAFKPADASFEPESSTPTTTDSSAATSASSGGSEDAAGGEVRVSPIARRLAEQLGVDLSKVKGTGRNGRISREDVEAYAAQMSQSPAADAGAATPARTEKLTSMRATIARRLTESSQTIPHYRLVMDLDVGRLLARRSAIVEGGEKISINDLLLKAVALALVEHPMVNAQFDGESVLQFDHADIAIAVATPTGLVTPILRQADTKSVAEIARAARELAERARAGKLAREEITGGTFTVSNLGMFGVRQFDAIINPPQVAILAVGAAEERIVARNGSPAAATIMTVTLSSDHRVVDGAVGGAFLKTLRTRVESADEL
ncbi:MAG TPA: dihydrolipoamide acetyltransferase family protein [Steroidobacteraceae bacterium]|nr:dihydrolipoamide acetyltransferase family protein [Steroidobacteraceae bacterium]